ncbi:AzlC family ABC transporter permease [Nocardioides sp. MAHUQ-72]|uniref:AzlC family ABC transporter permease n=1 Tax=unclassified Nocardioides TaxID=2615069 RepID=UPI00360AEC41
MHDNVSEDVVRALDHEVRRSTSSRTAPVSRPAGLLGRDGAAGARAMLPLLVAYAPFALIVGGAVAASDNPVAAWLSTWTIYGGAAHLVTLSVLAQGSGWVAAVVAGLLVQTRLSAYSTAMAPDWAAATLSQRLLAGVLLTDAPWALTRTRETGRRGFYLGAGLTLFVAWPAMVTVGVLTGDVLGGAPAAALVPALVLGCTVATQLRHRPALVASTAAGLSAVVTAPLSTGVALVAAAAAGIVGGLLADPATRGRLFGAEAS